MAKTLQQIKEIYAQKQGYSYWADLLNDDELELLEIYNHHDEIAKIYAIQWLEQAAEKLTGPGA